jgi:hypothetical protein
MEATRKRAAMEPNNPEAWHQMGPYYSEKAMKDLKLPKETAKKYVMRGLEVEDKALAINPEFWSAMPTRTSCCGSRPPTRKIPPSRRNY